MGSSIDVLYEALKIAHTYTFLTKNFYGFETVFRIMILWFSPCFYMRIMQSENFATYIHTHYRQSETAPLYTRIIYERNFAQIYMRIAARLESVGDWLGVDVLAFVCIMFCICGHRLDKVVFVDWCQNSIVKVWWDCINSL